MDYNNVNRGKIQFRDRARQIINYDGLRFKNITPTDIDGLIEYHDKGFVFYEYKLKNAKMSNGQRMALERLADAVQKGKKPAVVFLCTHSAENPETDIDAANARVIETYYNGKWHKKDGTRTVREHTQSFLQFLDDIVT